MLHYFKLPHHITTYFRGLNSTEISVYLEILRLSHGGQRRSDISLSKISEPIKISRQSAQLAVVSLEGAGMVRVERKGRKSSTIEAIEPMSLPVVDELVRERLSFQKKGKTVVCGTVRQGQYKTLISEDNKPKRSNELSYGSMTESETQGENLSYGSMTEKSENCHTQVCQTVIRPYDKLSSASMTDLENCASQFLPEITKENIKNHLEILSLYYIVLNIISSARTKLSLYLRDIPDLKMRMRIFLEIKGIIDREGAEVFQDAFSRLGEIKKPELVARFIENELKINRAKYDLIKSNQARAHINKAIVSIVNKIREWGDVDLTNDHWRMLFQNEKNIIERAGGFDRLADLHAKARKEPEITPSLAGDGVPAGNLDKETLFLLGSIAAQQNTEAKPSELGLEKFLKDYESDLRQYALADC